MAVAALAGGTAAQAGTADVVDARVRCGGAGACVFDVTVLHADTGWEHYADRWEIVGPDGAVLATRVLQHPHVSEQPFTRRLGPVKLPAAVTQVTIRARDSQHGYGGAELSVTLPRPPPAEPDAAEAPGGG